MKRYREFRGTFTRMEYDAEHGTFEWVAEVHPFLASLGAGVGIAADPQVENFIPTSIRGAIEAANPVCADYLLDPSDRFLIWDRATGMPVATDQGILVFLTEEEAITAINLLNSGGASSPQTKGETICPDSSQMLRLPGLTAGMAASSGGRRSGG